MPFQGCLAKFMHSYIYNGWENRRADHISPLSWLDVRSLSEREASSRLAGQESRSTENYFIFVCNKSYFGELIEKKRC